MIRRYKYLLLDGLVRGWDLDQAHQIAGVFHASLDDLEVAKALDRLCGT